MADTRKDQDRLPREEADLRRDELARRILRSPPEPRKPPKPHKPNDEGKAKTKNEKVKGASKAEAR